MNDTMNLTPTARRLIELDYTPIPFFDPAPGMRDDETMHIYCGKCGGSGKVDSPLDQGRCWKCMGTGGRLDVTVGSERKKERNRTNRANRALLKRAEEAIALTNERTNNWETFAQAHPTIITTLEGMHSAFSISLIDRIRDTGTLTDAQLDAVKRIAEEKANATPVTEGRQVITGEILSTKLHTSDYGDSRKMTVQDDRGFRVWGTMPASIDDELDEAFRKAGDVEWADFVKGHRVTFTATVTAAEGDDTFGFFKRPTKASTL